MTLVTPHDWQLDLDMWLADQIAWDDAWLMNRAVWHTLRLHSHGPDGTDPIAALMDTSESHETFAATLAEHHDYPDVDYSDDLLI